MTINIEELLVLLFLLRIGEPVLVDLNRRFLKAITASAQRTLFKRGQSIRFRAWFIHIWID